MILGIDPGAGGGIAWIDDDGIHAESMPPSLSEQADFIRSLVSGCKSQSYCLMERTGTYMPGNSAVAACTFARHCGHLEAILYCLTVPTVQITPAGWMRSIGAMPADKAQRKQAIKEYVARLYPTVKVTLKTSDALGILSHAISNKTIFSAYRLPN